MSRSQREKGKRGEREWREYLEAAGVMDAKRTGWKQSDGGDEPDVTHGVFAAEVKRHKKFWPDKVYSALRQADNTHAGIPYLVARGDDQPWLVAMYAKDFVELARLYDAYRLAVRIAGNLDDVVAFASGADVQVGHDTFVAKNGGITVSGRWAVGEEVRIAVRVDGFDFEVSNWHKADWRELMLEVGDGEDT